MISVLIPVSFHGFHYIESSISSVKNQTYKNWEIILGVFDKGIYNHVKKYEEKNIKAYECKTKNIIDELKSYSNNEWIAILDVYDKWHPEKIELQSKYMNNYDVIGTACKYIENINNFNYSSPGKISKIPYGNITNYDFSKKNPIIYSSLLIKKELCNLENKWIDLQKKGRTFYNLNNILVMVRLHNNYEKVSVIIPTYNRFKYLMNTIDSVRNQTHKNIEIIVVNDRSTQQEYYNYDWKDIKIIHLEVNSKTKYGIACPQRNFGVKVATGSYIAFCDDDDIWFPRKLELQLIAMKELDVNYRYTNAFSGKGIYNKNTKYRKYFEYKIPTIINLNMLKRSNSIICSSVLMTKNLWNKTGEFINGKFEDYNYWLRALQYTNNVYVNIPLVYYDKGHGDGQLYI